MCLSKLSFLVIESLKKCLRPTVNESFISNEFPFYSNEKIIYSWNIRTEPLWKERKVYLVNNFIRYVLKFCFKPKRRKRKEIDNFLLLPSPKKSPDRIFYELPWSMSKWWVWNSSCIVLRKEKWKQIMKKLFIKLRLLKFHLLNTFDFLDSYKSLAQILICMYTQICPFLHRQQSRAWNFMTFTEIKIILNRFFMHHTLFHLR